ncbi:MAG: carotenoid biosynthesis protein [Bacteroidales bacterium]|nr:carotenoid biosynthesis protein [Bacteroidales bacterium]
MAQKRGISKPTEILLWVYAVGLAGMLLPFSRELFKLITPLNLLFAASFLFWGKWPARQVILTGSFIAVASFLIEAAGTNTGNIFGTYSYGRTLGPALFNTPLIIGLNWFLLIYCTNVISRTLWQRLALNSDRRRGGLTGSLFIVFTGSVLMVLYDLFLEPAATRLEMWSWEHGTIPVRNYLGWFFFSAIFHLVTRIWGEEEINARALPLFTVQIGFFAAIDLFYWLTS